VNSKEENVMLVRTLALRLLCATVTTMACVATPAAYGQGCNADLNGDGRVDGADLATVEILELSRPTWVRPLLREFGSSAWRGRMGWLRARLAAADHRIAFFADTKETPVAW
jgi:hypothetical protein